MQHFVMIGNLTNNPELTETSTGLSVCRFSVAVNRSYADKDGEKKTDFFNVTAWRGLAENVAKYCKKGYKVCVQGEIQFSEYTDSDGIKHKNTTVMAQSIEFLTSPNKDGQSAQSAPRQRERVQSFDDDDIPF